MTPHSLRDEVHLLGVAKKVCPQSLNLSPCHTPGFTLPSVYTEHARPWLCVAASHHAMGIVFQPSPPPRDHWWVMSAPKSHTKLRPCPTARKNMVDVVTYTSVCDPLISWNFLLPCLVIYLLILFYDFCQFHLRELKLHGHLFHGAQRLLHFCLLGPACSLRTGLSCQEHADSRHSANDMKINEPINAHTSHAVKSVVSLWRPSHWWLRKRLKCRYKEFQLEVSWPLLIRKQALFYAVVTTSTKQCFFPINLMLIPCA